MYKEENEIEPSEVIFSYNVKKDNKVFIYWYDKLIKILSGEKAEKFLSQIEGAGSLESQQLLAKATGNLKRKKDENTNTIVIRGSHFTRKNNRVKSNIY
ncbi:hypothetical protein G9F72_013330 [Clostridium estertheticum]|uniref:hypothetical protein n=1 Tax=Clostridium estertheticum TaxID=238834 RepID=UPI0013E998B4|nr:hypothetical protein [Clostridium estertheticum]MBZ9687308.1 hypothetical protein [Clostridium estertheticum]